jgi:rod shape-determining protein MreB
VVDKETEQIIKVGREAQKMKGRVPDNIEVVRPLREGVISKYNVTLQMVQYFINRACGNMLIKPRVMICIPSGATEVDERAVIDAATQAGARQTFLVEEPVAAAIGAGLDISAPNGKMVVDIGGGTTDIAVMSLNGVVVSESIKIVGDSFDDAIMRYVRQKHGVLIGDNTARNIKRAVGTVYESKEEKTVEVKGRCIKTRMPEKVVISSRVMLEVLVEPLTAVLDAICSVIARTPPELVKDIMENGIVMTGGGSLLDGIDKLVEKTTGISTRVAKNPLSCVALGTGALLDNLSSLQEGALNLARERQKRL